MFNFDTIANLDPIVFKLLLFFMFGLKTLFTLIYHCLSVVKLWFDDKYKLFGFYL